MKRRRGRTEGEKGRRMRTTNVEEEKAKEEGRSKEERKK